MLSIHQKYYIVFVFMFIISLVLLDSVSYAAPKIDKIVKPAQKRNTCWLRSYCINS